MKKYNQFILEKLDNRDIINYYSGGGDESVNAIKKFVDNVDLKADIGKEYNVFGLLLANVKYDTVKYIIKNKLFGVNDNIYLGHQIGKVTNFITSVMFLAARNRTSILKFFLEQPGIDLEIKDKHGNTALIYASVNGYIQSFMELLKNGADPFVTLDGFNIFEIADSDSSGRWLQTHIQTFDFQDWFLTKYPSGISLFSDEMLAHNTKIKYADLITGKDLNLL